MLDRERPLIDVVGISGGKDSTATALHHFENVDTQPILLFCDTGLEADVTYEYIDYLDEKFMSLMGVGITRIKADLSEKMARRRSRLASQGFEERAKHMNPTGNPFLDACIMYGRFPTSLTRFCTRHTKLEPTTKFIRSLLAQNQDVDDWSGERADESLARSKKEIRELMMTDRKTGAKAHYFRPILRWSEQKCFDTLKRFGIEPNPLYAQGFKRVGCFPCINCRKEELPLISRLFPERIKMLRDWEDKVSLTSETGSRTFFARNGVPMTIEERLDWGKTSYGGKQYRLILED